MLSSKTQAVIHYSGETIYKAGRITIVWDFKYVSRASKFRKKKSSKCIKGCADKSDERVEGFK